MDGLILRSSSSYYGNIFLLGAFIYICETYHTFYWMLWVMYVLIPIIDHILPPSLSNPTPEQEKVLMKQKRFLIPIYLFIVMTWVTYAWAFNYLYKTEMTWFQFLTFCLVFGNIGILSLLYDHELFHKKDTLGRLIGNLDLIKHLAMHQYLEHVKGHHKWVATPLDMNTSRYGQSFYEFFTQSFTASFTSTWEREVLKLQKKNKAAFSPYNKMIQLVTCEIAFTYLVFHFYGAKVLLFFVIQAFLSLFILEEFNYFSHYGLLRKKLENGDYEPVQPKHSWSSHQLVANIIQVGLQRHPDHHTNSYRPYQVLRACTDGPALPCSYISCLVITLVPPVWYRITHPILEGYKKDGKASEQQLKESQNAFLSWAALQTIFVSALPLVF